MFPRWFPVISLLVSATALAGAKENVQEIQTRLDSSLSLYQQQKVEDARSTIQKAYFEIFENLEGPIRINHSARKSFQMESTFWEIRKMMGENKPLAEVKTAVEGLKKELTEVLPELESGHQLNAEGQHSALENQDILPYWKKHFQLIDDLLAQAIELYQAGEFSKAKATVQKAQYDGFKNSEMERAIRHNRSATIAANINQQFYDLIKLSEQKEQLTALGYQTTQLLQDLEEQLPQLPATREEQKEPPKKVTADNANAKDWQKISAEIQQGVEQAITLRQQNETPKATLALKIAYFEQFEDSGMGELVNQKNAGLKKAVDDSFNTLFGLIRTDTLATGDTQKMQDQVVKLRENFAKIDKLLK